jgi:hypothetical protein
MGVTSSTDRAYWQLSCVESLRCLTTDGVPVDPATSPTHGVSLDRVGTDAQTKDNRLIADEVTCRERLCADAWIPKIRSCNHNLLRVIDVMT